MKKLKKIQLNLEKEVISNLNSDHLGSMKGGTKQKPDTSANALCESKVNGPCKITQENTCNCYSDGILLCEPRETFLCNPVASEEGLSICICIGEV